jgi:hypothetical protein
MGRRRGGNLGLLVAIVAVLCIIIFLVFVPPASLGLDSGLLTSILAVLPGLIITVVGILGIGRDDALVIGGYGAAGLGIAILMGELYTASIINDTMLSGATLGGLEALIVVLSLVMGAVAYQAKR